MTVRRALAGLARARSGSVALTFALSLPVMIGAAAFATDMGNVYLQRRALQSATDAAALAAAGHRSTAQAVVRRVLDVNGHEDARFTLVFGRYEADDGTRSDRFVPDANGATARVESTLDVPLHLAGIFGLSRETVAARADAARQPIVSISAGSRLASVEPTLLNPLLKALLGAPLDIKVADYNALLTTGLPLATVLSDVVTALGASPLNMTLDEALTRPIRVSLLADILSRRADAKGERVAGAALRKIALQLQGSLATVKLGELVATDSGLRGRTVARVEADLSASVSVLGLLNAALGKGRLDADLETKLDLLGLASTKVALRIGEGMVAARPLAVTADLPRVETDQVRLRLQLELLGLLSGLGVGVNVPIEGVVAGGSAEVVSATCGDHPWEREVRVAVRPGLARLSIGEWRKPLSEAHIQDRLPAADLVRALLVRVEGKSRIDASSPARIVTFRGYEIGSGTVKGASTTKLASGLIGSLLGETELDLRILGLGVSTGGLLKTVEGLLGGLVSPVDAILDAVLSLAGVRLGELDVRVDDLVCHQARIVG